MTRDDDGGFPVPDIPTVSTDAFERAESLTSAFEQNVAKAVDSAMWHTIVDGAAREFFVDDVSVDVLREARRHLRKAGYASVALSPEDVTGGTDRTEGAIYFAGDDVADDYHDLVDDMVRVEHYDEREDFVPELPLIDGYLVERVKDGLPSNLIVLVDIAAVARVPPEARDVRIGTESTPAVSSPVVVTDPKGVVVVNVAQD
jgi:hypothetical protein